MARLRRKSRGSKVWVGKFLYGLSLGFLAFGLFNLAWAVWPYPTEAVQINIPQGVLPVAPEGTGFSSLADYTLGVSWPRWLRLGDVGSIDVIFSGESGQAGDRVQVVLIETTLQRLSVEPAGLVQYNMATGTDLTVSWVVDAAQKGKFPGKVLVSFGFFDEENDAMESVPVAVVDVEIRVWALWGVQANLLLWFGLVSLALWGALFLLGRVIEARFSPDAV